MLTNQIKEVFVELKNNENAAVVVEGKKDRKVLSRLGFKNIFEISGKSLHDVIENVKSNEPVSAIILTDFDRDGEEKASQLTKLFLNENIKINSSFRKKFKTLFKIHKIEEINSFTKLLEDDYYGKTCSIYDKIFDRGRLYCRRNGGKARCNRRDIRPD
jgi:5S rRNA maturation endonuclease (ribonuclease M5)